MEPMASDRADGNEMAVELITMERMVMERTASDEADGQRWSLVADGADGRDGAWWPLTVMKLMASDRADG